ncbi:MAG: hypothetical protein KJ066_03735 [Acidobacteria bacterium]|nr:hypothetical protein [Acidobacteriota bacterium]
MFSRRVSRPVLGAAAIVVVAAVLPMWPALSSGFVADDFFFAARYRDDAQGLAAFLRGAFMGAGDATTTFYRPLAFASLWIETRVWRDAAFAMHASQVLLHAAVALGIWRLGVRCAGSRGAVTGATLAVVLFAAFPRRVEAVAWVSCRPDLLAAALAVAMLVAWLAALRATPVDVPAGRAAGRAWVPPAAGAAVLWGLSLLAKESTLALPLALLAWRGPDAARTSIRERARLLVPFAIVGLAYLGLRRFALGAFVGGYGEAAVVPSLGSLGRALRHVAYLVVPPLEGFDALLEQRVGQAAVAVFVFGVVVLLSRVAWTARASAAVSCGAWWLAAALLPVFMLPISFTTTFNDRLLYLPGIGLALVLAGALARASRAWVAGLAVLACLSAAATHRTATRWQAAGEATASLSGQLAVQLQTVPAGTDVVLAAVPDSYRGAYMLRNGVAEALVYHATPASQPLRVASVYFVNRFDETPVRAGATSDGRLRVTGRDGRREVLPTAAVSEAGRVVEGPPDRYGRYASMEVVVPAASAVFVLTPAGVERVR